MYRSHDHVRRHAPLVDPDAVLARATPTPRRSVPSSANDLDGQLGVEVVRRDGSGSYGEAIRRALPGAVQAGDRWHLRHGLAGAVLKEVAAHSSCWGAGPPLNEGKQAQITAEWWR
jgi:hypothetical protein